MAQSGKATLTFGDLVAVDDSDHAGEYVVVNAPETPIKNWKGPLDGKTLAERYPQYPATAQTILIVEESTLEDYDENWQGRTDPYPIGELYDDDVQFEAVPKPHLSRAVPSGGDSQTSTSATGEQQAQADGASPNADVNPYRARRGAARTNGHGESTNGDRSSPGRGTGRLSGSGGDHSHTESTDPVANGGQDDSEEETPSPNMGSPDTGSETSESSGPSTLIQGLYRELTERGANAHISADGSAVIVEKLGEEYTVRPGEVKGDGYYRDQLQEIADSYDKI